MQGKQTNREIFDNKVIIKTLGHNRNERATVADEYINEEQKIINIQHQIVYA